VTPDLLLRGARVIDPGQGLDRQADVAIRQGRIVAVGERLAGGAQEEEKEEIAAAGCVLAPALIDAHCHLREPGLTHKETIKTGTAAAAHGGFGGVACMANTQPPIDDVEALGVLQDLIRRDAQVAVWPVAALTRGLEGQRLTDQGALAAAGAVAFSDDGRNAAAPDLLAEGLRGAARCGRPVLVHAELEHLMHGASRPRAAEEGAVEAALWALRRAPGARLHLQHLSTAEAVAQVRAARAAGLAVTAEVTPHHLALTAAAVREHGALAKVNPPLREDADRAALLAGLQDGTITVIATDHAPHEAAAKRDLASAAPGIAGLETALALLLRLPLPLPRLLEALTVAPARLLGLPIPTLRPGALADCVLFNPEREWVVRPQVWQSRGQNTPLMGARLRGEVLLTLACGRVAYRAEVLVG
jgi:dihydroorotase